ncbi:glucosamine inositolphosphorylceramide transferase family protein [Salinimicrobium sediminilitoris]|uniref:glucosamine inositolphosphorylceramide transferase family protein n=1 Tax=Salinimicrobium sediminilitoris TaxID=2876715 RepID=UPI001E490D75|nr:hypothetical protein [Salinimicrobium sediminilitoris]MCC8358540.1 hypothetical protein [Salinimicrobium sediminilitoris]
MKKRIIIVLSIFFFTGIIILLVFNARYPFFNPSVGNWSVGYHHADQVLPEVNVSKGNIITYEYIKSITSKKTEYIADPFFIKEKDTFYLFVELKGEGNANIALLTSADGEKYVYKGIILDEEFHLSYPQVFRYNGEFYLLPETIGAKGLILYKAEKFPFTWKPVDTLVSNKHLKDPSLLLSEDLNMIVAVDDELKQYMFVADSLNGVWREAENYKPRWGNETRPGGRFFKLEGEWYLPVQNASKGYGTGISLYKVYNQKTLELRPAKKLYLGPQNEIQWFNRGMHHLDIQDIDGGFYMVYDGDRNFGEEEFQYKRTIKLNLIDLYNYFR